MTSRGSYITSNSRTHLKNRRNSHPTSVTTRPVHSYWMKPPGSFWRALINKAPKMSRHLRIRAEIYSKAKRSYSYRESWISSRGSRWQRTFSKRRSGSKSFLWLKQNWLTRIKYSSWYLSIGASAGRMLLQTWTPLAAEAQVYHP